MTDGAGQDDDLVRAAWLYHVGRLSQEEVSHALSLSRFKVLRLLAEARERGLVRVTVAHETTETLALGDLLARRLGVAQVLVAPDAGPGDEAARRAVGQLAAAHLARIGATGAVTIGMGWGRTIAAMADAVGGLRNPELTFVSQMGTLSRTFAAGPFDVCVRLAALTGGQAVFLPAPFLTDTQAECAMVMRLRQVGETLQVARTASHMMISAGDCSPGGTLAQSGLLSAADLARLAAAGAVADTTGKFLRADGSLAPVDLNERSPSVGLDDLARADTTLILSGAAKAGVVRAVIAAGFVRRLIVDAGLAAALLAS